MITEIIDQFKAQQYKKVCENFELNQPKILPAQIHYLVAISYLFVDLYENAQKELLKLYKSREQLADYNTYLSMTYLKLGDYKKAKQKIMNASTKYSVLYFELMIEIAMKLGQQKSVRYYLKKAYQNGCVSHNIQVNEAILMIVKYKYEEAQQLLENIIKVDIDNIAALNNLVRVYKHLWRKQKLEIVLTHYLKSNPGYLPYIWELAQLYSQQARHEKLSEIIKDIYKADPESASIREVFLIPSNHDSNDQIINYRKKIHSKINDALKKELYPIRADKQFRSTAFYLSYHQELNHTILNDLYKLMSKRLPVVKKIKKPKNKKKKIGIISQYLYKHSVMDFYFETLKNLPDEFHITIINIDPIKVDAITRALKKRADAYFQPSVSQEELIPLIMNQNFDMIIYTEIGMSPNCYYLAMQRLAPLQIVLIGHPETSGMNTIDYFISWKYFHSHIKNPEKQFTESLVQLNQFPLFYEWPKELNKKLKSRKELGLPDDSRNIYLIPMLLFKIHPVFDCVIKGILEKDARSEIILICYNKIEDRIKMRMKRTISSKYLGRIHFKLPFSRDDYFSALQLVDVLLETFPFGGGNTVLQSFASKTPIITLKGTTLRGSFGTAFYNFIKEPSFIANSIEEYIDLCVKVANNPSIKQGFSNTVNKNKDKIFNNMDGVHEFYQWLHMKLYQ